ncbi:MAG: excinuclease ABC subunit UvrC [Candidatus Latescibacterota bacterium]|nr:MAG: excinuclease ABC subunit UvrC [Candidatus Latescibacterota bacterium]
MSDEHDPLAEKIRQLPEEPGVYLFKDARGKVLYVGKAKSIRDRVRSYRGASAEASAKTRVLMSRARDIDYVSTRTEVEALVLECNLIKEYRPRYNVRLRDDKKFPYIRVTRDEFPRVFLTRTLIHDGSEYFGPYSDVGAMRRTLALLQRVFWMRPCTPETLDGIDRPCLYYDIKMCGAPCVGLQSHDEYLQLVEDVRMFLGGRTQELESRLQQRMQAESDGLEFERAARTRDQLRAIGRITDRMRTLVTDALDRDAIAMQRDGGNCSGVVMKIRGGKLLSSESFYFTPGDEEDAEVFAAFFQQYYNSTSSIPDEIVVSHALREAELLERWLGEKRERRLRIVHPQRGEKQTLVRLASKNARLKLDEWLIAHGKAERRAPEDVVQLRDALGMRELPRRIECFDISNFQGAHPVASLVHFDAGEPVKNRYRHFRIRGIEAPNDFAMMEHVVERHFRSLVRDGHALPLLVMVDGGRGQLSAALRALERLELRDPVHLIGLAKRNEEIYSSAHEAPLQLARTSPALKLLQRIRNEAHRFAIGYHRRLRGAELVRSALDDIPGVGLKTRLALLRSFGSVDAVARASAEELARVPGVGPATAERILAVLSHPALRQGQTNAPVTDTLPDAEAPAAVGAEPELSDPADASEATDILAAEIDVDPALPREGGDA